MENISFAETPSFRLIAKFSTYYGESSDSRKHNVALASSKINGLTLYPEEEFSFNDTVGKRSKENGFQSAFIISQGKFVEGTGGGVCQVSTTLYNCALLANLTITCVHPHSLAVSYVAPSFDAMVSSVSDLRFVNSLSAPITIKCVADGKFLKFEIYGHEQFNIRRRYEKVAVIPYQTTYVEDSSMQENQRIIDTHGIDGFQSKGYLDYYQNKKLVKTVQIRSDKYQPLNCIILTGKKPELKPENKQISQ